MPRAVAVLFVLVATVVAVALLVRFGADGPERADADARPGESSASAPGVARGAERVAERPAVAPPADAIDDAGEDSPPATADLPDRPLTILVLDPVARPVAGATVELQRVPAQAYGGLDLAAARERTELARGATDADGRFVSPVAPGRPVDVIVTHPPFATAHLRQRFAGETVEVQLVDGAVVQGTVTRDKDGSAVAAARVSIQPQRPEFGIRTRGGRLETETASDGTYRLVAVPPGDWSMSVRAVGEASPRRIEVHVRPREIVRRDVVIVETTDVRGRVTDARTGRPLAGAEIGEGWTYARSVRSDAAGEFLLPQLSPGYLALHVRAEGYGDAEVPLRDRLDDPPVEFVEVELVPGRTCRGRLVGPDAQPVVGAYVAATASEHGSRTQKTDWRAGRSSTDGTFVLSGLRRDVHHVLLAREEGFGTVTYDFPDDESARDVIDFGDVRLSYAAVIEGVVESPDGAPFADRPITLRGWNADRHEHGRIEGAWSIDGYVAERKGRSDDRGRFAFHDLAPGTYRIEARIEGVHRAAEAEVAVPEGAHVTGVRLVLDPGFDIAGRIEVSDGGPIPKGYVSVDPEERGPSADIEVAADGSFHARGLGFGTYALTVYPYASEEDKRAGRVFASITLKNVQAGRRDVRIVLTRRRWIRGHVDDGNGDPAAGAWVQALEARAQIRLARCADDGTFEIELPDGTVVDLVAWPPDAFVDWAPVEPRPDPARNDARADVEAGEEDVRLRLGWTPE